MGAIPGVRVGGSLRQLAAIVLILAGLGLFSLFFIIPHYHMRQLAISMSREQVLRGNMRLLQVTLEQYLAEGGRGYPSSLHEAHLLQEDPMMGTVSSQLRRLQNPFDRDLPAVAMSRRDPPRWESFKPGQVIYVPLGIVGDHAAGYVIYGLGSKGPLSTVFARRPEPFPPTPSGTVDAAGIQP
jgi:hypothetical protein